MKNQWSRLTAALTLLAAMAAPSAWALGERQFVEHTPKAGAVLLAAQGRAAPLLVDAADDPGVRRAVASLQGDIERVSGARPVLAQAGERAEHAVLVGTLGQSPLIDRLAREGKIDAASVRGKWEGYLIQTVRNPLPGVARALVVAGSDRRGTIYGVYTLSEQIGVSPWYWWADVAPVRRSTLAVAEGTRVSDAPVVQYRGIFLNDEAPALTGWAKEKFGGYNHKFYEHVFELLLRMRANYLWPAMWPPTAFFDDDPKNGQLAHEMGIVMGTSHHEPMMRAHEEWGRYGKGAWDYSKNADVLRDFWLKGLRGTKDYDRVITLGMRGDGDEPMSEHDNVELLQKIVGDQRAMIARETGKPVEKVPQLWALYKEVHGYYEKGMRVPDDVLLLWCDDNWANIRRLPTPEERKRPGGAGVYYHFDYVGGPRSYKWLNVTPIPKIWEQMHLAWQYDAKRMWIVNVGDLKPMEVPTEFFLTYAWNPAAWPAERLPQYLRTWATREFGAEHAGEVADLVEQYTRFNGRRKPEQLEPGTYSAIHYDEARRIAADYNVLAERARKLAARLKPEQRDAFFQLVQYPVEASANANELYVAAQLNRLYASQFRATTNDMAARVRALFERDAELSRQYHQLGGGKWNHMMSQTRFGYVSWDQPPRDVMPALQEVRAVKGASMGVAVEGSDKVLPTWALRDLTLPELDVYSKRPRYLEVYNRGSDPFEFRIESSQPWVVLSQSTGNVTGEQRIWVNVDWDKLPADPQAAVLTIHGPNKTSFKVNVPVRRPDALPVSVAKGFIETTGVVSIEAEHYDRALAPQGRSWLTVPGHGRTLSGVTPLPVTGPALAPKDGMRLEYDVHLFKAGPVKVQATLAPTLKFQPGAGFRYAVSIDDEPPQIVNVHADGSERHWARIVSDGAAVFSTSHQVKAPGRHVLRFWALDPGLVIQKLVIDAGGLKPSYLGPPESPRFR
jgi:hypothetical protein